MPNKKTYLIYVIGKASDDEINLAKQYRAKRNNAHFRNARYFGELEACDGVLLGKSVANQFPGIAQAYQEAGIEVEDLDVQPSDEQPETEQTPIKPEPSDNIYEWTRQECLDWLKANEVEIPSDGYQSKSDLQTLVLENIGNG